MKPELSKKDEQLLLDVAWRSLEAYFRGEDYCPREESSPSLNRFFPVFVTLRKDSALRGCIGFLAGDQPLTKTVAECVRAAALRDPRFPSLRVEELERLEIEISVLHSFSVVHQPSEIVIGRHGLIISADEGYDRTETAAEVVGNKRRGLLLPQVAVEHHLDPLKFLDWTCQKAGLRDGAWRTAHVESFEAQIFSSRSRT